MRYCKLYAVYENVLNSNNNFRKALRRIGEIDPYKIKRTTLRRTHLSIKEEHEMTSKDFEKRGILNVRRRLNGHNGKSGKYSIGMIKFTSIIKKCSGDSYMAKLPKKDYIAITTATYLLLWQYDQQMCKDLLNDTLLDNIPSSRNISMNTIAPIQTDIVFRSTGKNKEVQKFIDYACEVI